MSPKITLPSNSAFVWSRWTITMTHKTKWSNTALR